MPELPRPVVVQVVACSFWRQRCHGLDVNGVIEAASSLTYAGTFNEAAHPLPFICLLHKLLSLEPSVEQYVTLLNHGHRYVRLLGAVGVRYSFAGSDSAVAYTLLEPLYQQYDRIIFHYGGSGRVLTNIRPTVSAALTGVAKVQQAASAQSSEWPKWSYKPFDACIEELLTQPSFLGVALPPLLPRPLDLPYTVTHEISDSLNI